MADETNTNKEENEEDLGEIEINLEDFSKEELIGILSKMNESDLTFNEFFEQAIQNMLESTGGDFESFTDYLKNLK